MPINVDERTVAGTYLNKRRHVGAEARTKASDYWDLAKPEITFLVGISSLAGFFLASGSSVDTARLSMTLVGVMLTSAGGGILNHLIERRLDSKMKRTSNRPLAAERVSPIGAGLAGGLLVLCGVLLLLVYVNPLTAALAAATVCGYLYVYTPLKTRTRYNTLVGCVPGALPALGGWTAATGSVGTGGLVLFAILFTWQMPHFLSLAWMYRKDYERAGFAMLPVLEPDGGSTGIQTLAFTGAVVLFSIVPFATGLAGLPYLAGVLAVGIYFLTTAIRFRRSLSNGDARRVLLASVVYVHVLVGAILLDQLV
jgi:protoheme IX farnesyltransferase